MLLLSLLLGSALSPATSMAAAATNDYLAIMKAMDMTEEERKAAQEKPLLEVQMPEGDLHYQLAAQNAVRRAVHEWPAVRFDILLQVPSTGDFMTDSASMRLAQERAVEVERIITSLGFARTRFDTHYQTRSDIINPILSIYARSPSVDEPKPEVPSEN